MKDREAFAAQDGIDYGKWCELLGDGLSKPVLKQIQIDIAAEINKGWEWPEDDYLQRAGVIQNDMNELMEKFT